MATRRPREPPPRRRSRVAGSRQSEQRPAPAVCERSSLHGNQAAPRNRRPAIAARPAPLLRPSGARPAPVFATRPGASPLGTRPPARATGPAAKLPIICGVSPPASSTSASDGVDRPRRRHRAGRARRGVVRARPPDLLSPACRFDRRPTGEAKALEIVATDGTRLRGWMRAGARRRHRSSSISAAMRKRSRGRLPIRAGRAIGRSSPLTIAAMGERRSAGRGGARCRRAGHLRRDCRTTRRQCPADRRVRAASAPAWR